MFLGPPTSTNHKTNVPRFKLFIYLYSGNKCSFKIINLIICKLSLLTMKCTYNLYLLFRVSTYQLYLFFLF